MRKIITGHGASHRPASGNKPRCLWTGGRRRQGRRSMKIAAYRTALTDLRRYADTFWVAAAAGVRRPTGNEGWAGLARPGGR
jgi:hypothetical protein